MIKTIYKNPRANDTFNIEKLEAFTLRSSTKNGYSHLTLLFNTALEVLANTIKEQQQKKGMQMGEGRHKTIFYHR